MIRHAPSLADLQPAKLLSDLEVFVEIQEGINADFKAIGDTFTNPYAQPDEIAKPTEPPAQELDSRTKLFKHHNGRKKEKHEPVRPAEKLSLGLKPFVAPKPVLEDIPAVQKPTETTVDATPMDKNSDWVFKPSVKPEEDENPIENPIEIPVDNLHENPVNQKPTEKPAPKRIVEVQKAANQVAPVYASKQSGLQELDLPPLNMAPPNRNFVFHNKMPKCGGTSMKYILYVLSEDNDFYLDYQPPCLGDRRICAKNGKDGTDGELELARHVSEKRNEKDGKYFLLKHHHWMNFTDVELEQPTYMNVIRHPMGRFNSVYYFQRYGFAQMGSDKRQGARHTWKGSQEDFDQTLGTNLVLFYLYLIF